MKAKTKQGKPAWAREKAFALKPATGEYGFLDDKGKGHGFESLEALRRHLESGRGRILWVWTPERERVVAPEEVGELADTLRKRRLIFARGDEEDARQSLPFTGIGLLLGGYAYVTGAQPLGFHGLEVLIMAGLAFLYFTARPWWASRKGRQAARDLTRERMAEEIPEARFDLWMETQKAPLTKVLLGLVAFVWIIQMITPGLGIKEAGLDKIRYALGERWRLFTGAFLHGNLIHFVLNASALWYLGRRVEILARWPQLATSFLLSMVGGGWATISWWQMKLSLGKLQAATSVGVSGAVCGLLGFLLVFETLHRPLVPRPARRRLAAILVSLVVIGILGFRFIDNAAHFGGLAIGAVYAFLVFPKSSSPERPRILGQDYVIGGVALALIGASAAVAVAAMLGWIPMVR
jgi:membrane associated rhomboid family serine protease